MISVFPEVESWGTIKCADYRELELLFVKIHLVDKVKGTSQALKESLFLCFFYTSYELFHYHSITHMAGTASLNCCIKSGENNCSCEHLHQMVVITVPYSFAPFTNEMAEVIEHTHRDVHCDHIVWDVTINDIIEMFTSHKEF